MDMKLLIDKKRPKLVVGNTTLEGLFNNKPAEWYFGCTYIFDFIPDDFSFDDLHGIPVSEYADSVCLTLGCQSSVYEYARIVNVGFLNNKINMRITCDYDLERWHEKISESFFLPELERELKKSNIYNVLTEFDFSTEDNFIHLIFSADLGCDVYKIFDEACHYVAEAHRHVSDGFEYGGGGGFISKFKFPAEYKSIFVQYLTYFGQFLEDLGIHGDLSLSNRHELTCLSFNPSDQSVALENIAAALSSYLSLPESNLAIIVPNGNLESEVRFQQLASVVEHLKSQLRLSNAIISLKEKEISLLERAVDKVEFPLPSKVIKDYWEPVSGIRITSYKGKFFEIDIPKLINRLSGGK